MEVTQLPQTIQILEYHKSESHRVLENIKGK